MCIFNDFVQGKVLLFTPPSTITLSKSLNSTIQHSESEFCVVMGFPVLMMAAKFNLTRKTYYSGKYNSSYFNQTVPYLSNINVASLPKAAYVSRIWETGVLDSAGNKSEG